MKTVASAICPIPPSIDPEFRDLLPTLAPDERAMLKRQIRDEGRLLSPLIVWAEQNVLIEGHHRQELIQELRNEGIDIDAKA